VKPSTHRVGLSGNILAKIQDTETPRHKNEAKHLEWEKLFVIYEKVVRKGSKLPDYWV